MYISTYNKSTFNLKQLPPEIYQMIQDRKSERFEAELKQVNETVNNTDMDLAALHQQLSPTAQRVLKQVKAGNTDIPSPDWKTLCSELEKLGIISSKEAQAVSPDYRPFPVSYLDEDENIVFYDPPPPFPNLITKELWPMYMDKNGEMRFTLDWSGNPLQHIDDWMQATKEWLDDLAKMRKADGSPVYNQKALAPIQNKLDANQKVYDLVKNLSGV